MHVAMSLQPRMGVMVNYEGEELWRERLLLARTRRDTWIVYLPDEGVVEEDAATLMFFQVCNYARASARGVLGPRSYRLSGPFYSEALLDGLIAAGEEMVALLYDAQASLLLLVDLS